MYSVITEKESDRYSRITTLIMLTRSLAVLFLLFFIEKKDIQRERERKEENTIKYTTTCLLNY